MLMSRNQRFRPPTPSTAQEVALYRGPLANRVSVESVTACTAQTCEAVQHKVLFEHSTTDIDRFRFLVPFSLHTLLTDDEVNPQQPIFHTEQGVRLGHRLESIDGLADAGFGRYSLSVKVSRAIGAPVVLSNVMQALRESACPELSINASQKLETGMYL